LTRDYPTSPLGSAALRFGDAGLELLDFSLLSQGVAAVPDRPVGCWHH
jgi:hypothetical protein